MVSKIVSTILPPNNSHSADFSACSTSHDFLTVLATALTLEVLSAYPFVFAIRRLKINPLKFALLLPQPIVPSSASNSVTKS